MIYFDNAATTGAKPKGVIDGVKQALERYCANPGRAGHSRSIEAAEIVYKTREKLSDFSVPMVLKQWFSHKIVPIVPTALLKGF